LSGDNYPNIKASSIKHPIPGVNGDASLNIDEENLSINS